MAMKFKNIDAQVRSLEEELKTLKKLIEYSPEGKKEGKTFASLRGIWKDKVHFTMEEIRKAEIKVKRI